VPPYQQDNGIYDNLNVLLLSVQQKYLPRVSVLNNIRGGLFQNFYQNLQ